MHPPITIINKFTFYIHSINDVYDIYYRPEDVSLIHLLE